MALKISDLKVILSGGDTNTTPVNSLGGLASTDAANEVLSQGDSISVTQNIPINSYNILNAYGNAEGAGTLNYNSVSGDLSWKPNGGVSLIGVNVPVDGVYVIGDSSGYLIVDVTVANLPGSTTQDTDIIISNILNNTFDSVSAVESTDGRIEYRCFYIKNEGDAIANDVRVWVKQQPIGPDELDLSISIPTGSSLLGDALGPLADEVDTGGLLAAAIVAVELTAWDRPSTQATGLALGSIAIGECVYFWERRIVWPETTEQVPNDTSRIGISALI